MSEEQLQNELHYFLSVGIIKKMLEKGLISKEEFQEADRLNRISFPPKLAAIMS